MRDWELSPDQASAIGSVIDDLTAHLLQTNAPHVDWRGIEVRLPHDLWRRLSRAGCELVREGERLVVRRRAPWAPR